MKGDEAFKERPSEIIEVEPAAWHRRTRRDFLVFGASALGALAVGKSWRQEGWLAKTALRFDDAAAAALYSQNRLVPTYTKSQLTPLRNNYNGATPGPGYLPAWHLTLDGLSSGLVVSVDIHNLLKRHQAGLKFDDLLQAYPPVSQAKWALLESSVNLDSSGNPDPYFVSIDLATARHPQTLLATHFNGQPLTVDHGAPLRLLAPSRSRSASALACSG